MNEQTTTTIEDALLSIEVALRCGHTASIPAELFDGREVEGFCDECDDYSVPVAGLNDGERGEWDRDDLEYVLYGPECETIEF